MTASVSRSAMQTGRHGRLWWLPAGGYGNGLDDQAWAPVLELSEQVIPQVLGALRDVGVPAYMARVRPALRRRGDRERRPDTYWLWVGASAYGRAETALLTFMPQLAREAGTAWR